MAIYKIFNLPRGAILGARKSSAGGGSGAPSTQGAFVTPQSLASFLGASGVVALLWKVAGLLIPSWAGSMTAAFVCAVAVGAALFYISESDPARGKLTRRDYIIDGIVGFLNILVLFSAAIGGTAAVTDVVDPGPPAPPSENRPA